MTISTSASSIIVSGDGVSSSFAFPFIGDSAANMSVSTIAADGTMVLLSPTQYVIALNAPAVNQLWGVGGTVTYPLSGSPIAIGSYLLIQRSLPFTQQISVQNQGNYYAQVTEQALDILEMQIQQLAARTTQFRGIWVTGVNYNFGDIVQDGPNGNDTRNYYIADNSNLSGVWSDDLAAGDWSVSVLAVVPSSGNALTLTGDVTASGPLSGPIAATLATVNPNVGTFTNATVQVDAKGRVTGASTGVGSSAMTLISSQVITTNVAAVSVITGINSSFSHYIWEISNLTSSTANVDAYLTFQQGGVFVGGTSYNSIGVRMSTGGSVALIGDAAAAHFDVTAAGGAIQTSTPSVIRVEFWNPSKTSALNVLFESLQNDVTTQEYVRAGGAINTAAATTGIKLVPSAGSISGCIAKLFGVL